MNEIKIDKSFVMNMAHDDNDRVIVRSTIDLAHNLGLSVVAEGVENEETWRELQSFGCDSAQGYYIARPVPASDVVEGLRSSPVQHQASPEPSMLQAAAAAGVFGLRP